jgi:NADPH:quinone reductase-like Zn-dependent oxidoreductase
VEVTGAEPVVLIALSHNGAASFYGMSLLNAAHRSKKKKLVKQLPYYPYYVFASSRSVWTLVNKYRSNAMAEGIKGKVIVTTGASSGLGAAAARLLAKGGAGSFSAGDSIAEWSFVRSASSWSYRAC